MSYYLIEMSIFFNRPAFDYIIAGLGNPGKEYDTTRHNAGFIALDRFAEKHGTALNSVKFSGLCGNVTVGTGEDAIRIFLIKPTTYMNLSGIAIAAAARYYKIQPERVIVISDDVNLQTGRLRVRQSGSAGGHNGLKSIIAELGTDAFPRIRLGVGAPGEHTMVDWVLSKISSDELNILYKAADGAGEAALEYIRHGVAAAAGKFNGCNYA